MTSKDVKMIVDKELPDGYESGQISEFKGYYVCQIIPKGASFDVATGTSCALLYKDSNKVEIVSNGKIDMTTFIRFMD